MSRCPYCGGRGRVHVVMALVLYAWLIVTLLTFVLKAVTA